MQLLQGVDKMRAQTAEVSDCTVPGADGGLIFSIRNIKKIYIKLKLNSNIINIGLKCYDNLIIIEFLEFFYAKTS